MKKILAVAMFLSLLVGCATSEIGGSQKPEVRFKDGKLKIAQFTDMHWAQGGDLKSDQRLPEVLKAVVNAENPDLLVFTGDIVTGGPVVPGWKKFLALMDEIGVPFALVMGNHDPETFTTEDWSCQWERQQTRDSVFTMLENSPLFVGEKGDAGLQGLGNYVVPVLASDGSSKVKSILYCMDSYDYSEDVRLPDSYGWLADNQVQWYRRQSKAYADANGGRPVPALAFFHIPLPEYKIIRYHEATIGNRPENVCSPEINTGMFFAMFEMKDVMGVFVGHDHNNDYIGQYAGIALAYGKATGVDTYGEFEKGGRIIELYEDSKSFETWLRTESGDLLDRYYYPFKVSEQELAEYELMPACKAAPSKEGVSYKYYEGPFESVRKFEAEGKMVEEGTMPTFDIKSAKTDDHFGYEFESWFKAPETGVYKFYLTSDDGSVLTLDGKVVIDLDGSSSSRTKEVKVYLEKGYHDLELRYFDDCLYQKLYVNVVGPGVNGLDGTLYVK